jgi:hypothetical protein
MNPWIILAWIVTAGAGAVFTAALVWIWLGFRNSAGNSHGDVRPGFSLARYQVMDRLLSARDLQFLATQPGFTPGKRARWKRDSLRLFRRYLRDLTRDFQALHAEARRLVAESHSESPELASTLVRQQFAFWRARLVLEGRLLLFEFGIGEVNVTPLLAMIEAMRVDLRRLAPEPGIAQ